MYGLPRNEKKRREYYIVYHKKSPSFYKAEVSNKQPAGLMWPAWCDCKARVVFNNCKITIIVLCDIKAFYPILRPAEILILNVARELFFCQNAAYVLIWIWDLCLRQTWKKYRFIVYWLYWAIATFNLRQFIRA